MLLECSNQECEWARHVAYMGDVRNAYIYNYVRKPACKRPLGRPRYRWRIIHVNEIGWKSVDCVHLARNNACMNMIVNFRFA
jgi:hypothetical protein